MSNSAYYSLRTPVTNVSRAITVLGFSTVRSMAAAATAGLDDGSELPAGFWDHAAATAHATQLVAPRYMVPGGDVFALGLLHAPGTALPCRADPEQWERISPHRRNPHASSEVHGLAQPQVSEPT